MPAPEEGRTPRCDTNKCPTGVATEDAKLVKRLVVDEKKHRVGNFHRHTIRAVMELMAAWGVSRIEGLQPDPPLHARDCQA